MKKRFPAMILALALCMGLAVPAFAADSDFIIENGVLIEYIGPGGDVSIPNGVTEIGELAFDPTGMENVLTSVTIPNSVTKIGPSAFYASGLNSIVIPDSVTTIEKAAFMFCEDLTNVTMGSSVTTIGENAFRFCPGLTSIVLPDGLTTIGDFAFHGCDNLKSITIPSSVTDIAWSAFTIHDDSAEYVPIPGLTLHGASGSYAEHYAKENGIPFVSDGVPQPTPFFTDVDEGGYYADAVKWAVTHEPAITNGTSTTTFSPDEECTQAQILTFLWRAAGEPEIADKELPFEVDNAYRGAVLWADDMGMIDRGTFNPSTPCTRSAAVRFIWQAFLSPGTEKAASFTDVAINADYATAVSWALANGITNGTTETTFGPDEVCSRGQIVTFLHRAYVEEARLTVEK